MINVLINKKILLLMLLLLVLPLSACSPIDSSPAKSHGISVEWYDFFGGVYSDSGECIDLTNDGGYILTGCTRSHEGYVDIWLIKTNAEGKLLWERTLGGEFIDRGHYVQQTTDGGYIVVGNTYSSPGYQADTILIKTDADGNETWSKLFDGNGTDTMYCVIQTADSGYIMVGQTEPNTETYYSDLWLIKTDADGNELWNKTFGGADTDIGYYVQQTTDGGYILTGETKSYDIEGEQYDAWLIKIDANGNELWNKRFGGIGDDAGHCVQQIDDGGYIIAGTTESYSEGKLPVAWLIKTDTNGNEIWNNTYNNFSGSTLGIFGKYFVQQTSDHGYIISGSCKRGNSHYRDGFVMKTDADGNYLWHITFGGSKGGDGSCVRETADGDYIVTGYVAKQPWIWETWNPDQDDNKDLVLIKIGAKK